MSFVFKLLLCFLLDQPTDNIQPGTYVATYHKYPRRDSGQRLSLNKDHSFTRTHIEIKMCIGAEVEWDVGTWYQEKDELVLIDTLIYPVRINTITARIFGTTDTAIVRLTKYRIRKSGQLQFINSKAGKARHHLPNFIYQNDAEDKRSRMLSFCQ